MWRNIFTSYIIRNGLNLETLFEPIIDFIEIGENPPLRTVYETFISYSSSKNTQIIVEYRLESLKLLNLRFNRPKCTKEEKQIESSSFLLCGDNTKISSWLNRLYVSPDGPLESSLYLFYLFFFNLFLSLISLFFSFFIIALIGIFLLRPYESIQTSDSY